MAAPIERAPVRPSSFRTFKGKILAALRRAGFSKREVARAERIMDNAEKRNLIFIQALLSSLRMAGIPPDDLEKLRALFFHAYKNMMNGKQALSPQEGQFLIELLARNRLPPKAAHKLEHELRSGDEELAQELTHSFSKSDFFFSLPFEGKEIKKKKK